MALSIIPNFHIAQAVADQLPRLVRERVQVYVTADPYLLKTRVSILDRQTNRIYDCVLEPDERGRMVVVPEAFIAHLCAAL